MRAGVGVAIAAAVAVAVAAALAVVLALALRPADPSPRRPAPAPAPARLAAPGDVDCVVTYSVTTPCSGDCWEAWEDITGWVTTPPAGAGQPCPPLVTSASCARSMPCSCRASDLPLSAEASVTTCGDGCDFLPPGETCFLQCSAPGLTMRGLPEMTCANGTWAYSGFPPACDAPAAACPPVLAVRGEGSCGGNGVVVLPGSTCVGATHGDECAIACAAGFYVPAGGATEATCVDGTWSAPLACAPQAGCVASSPYASPGTGDTCAGTGCSAAPVVGLLPPSALLP